MRAGWGNKAGRPLVSSAGAVYPTLLLFFKLGLMQVQFPGSGSGSCPRRALVCLSIPNHVVGKLADVAVLDTRQYRSKQPCGDGIKANCEEALPLAPFPLPSPARFSRSVPEPDRASRCLYAGCRSVGIRASSELVPQEGSPPGSDIA